MTETFAGKAPLSDLLELVGTDAMQVQRYSVTGVLGEGGMGKVYLGFDETLGREVAIKVLAQTDESLQLAERFYREAKTMAALSHPNIIKIMDYSGAKARRQFLVMERLTGSTLQTFINRAPLSERAAVIVGHELASALAHAHSVGVLHRDLKPENIYVEPNGRVVLIDFGLAKGLMSESTRKTFIQSKTKILGTPLFGSPEQFSGTETLTALADIFSLGATLYYATSQVYPFRADDLFELLDKVRKEPHIPLPQLVEVSDAFSAIIDRCLKKRPKDRFASGDELAQTFLTMMQEARVGAPGPALKAALSQHAERPVDPQSRKMADTLAAPQARARAEEDEEHLVNTAPGWRNDSTQVGPARGRDDTQVGQLTQIAGADTRISRADTRVSRHDPFASTHASFAGRRAWMIGGAALAAVGLVVAALWWKRNAPPAAPEVAAPVAVVTTPVAAVPVAPAAPPAAPVRATLRLIVAPWAKVKIDGEWRGTTPSLRTVELMSGTHTVELANPSFPVKTLQVDLPAAGTLLDVDLAAK